MDTVSRTAAQAYAYWSQRRTTDYDWDISAPSTKLVCETVAKWKGTEDLYVFEFGCGIGRNLHMLKQEIPGIAVHGADINHEAIAAGSDHFDVPLSVAHEATLIRIPDDHYSCAFTCSVLSHLLDPKEHISELCRISHRFAFFIEPYNPHQCGNRCDYLREWSWFWNYPEIFRELGVELLESTPVPLEEAGLGPFFTLYVVKP